MTDTARTATTITGVLLLVVAAIAFVIIAVQRLGAPLPECTQDDVGTVYTVIGKPVSCGCAAGATVERTPNGCICRCSKVGGTGSVLNPDEVESETTAAERARAVLWPKR